MIIKKTNQVSFIINIILVLTLLSLGSQVCAEECEDKQLIEKIIVDKTKIEIAPKCLQDLNEINKISADDLAARLIFSEASAAYCTHFDEQQLLTLFRGIGHVIYTRSQSRQFQDLKILESQFIKETNQEKSVRAVILKPKQFSSSFGKYSCSSIKELLCPTRNAQFNLWWPQIIQVWELTKKNQLLFKNRKHAYFYYLTQHFEQSTCKKKYPEPPWTKSQNPLVFDQGQNLSSCVLFFEKIK